MRNKPLMLIAAATLSSLWSCATRVIPQPCPKPAPLPANLQVPAPDPLLFEKCLQELLALTSGSALTPSCKQLSDWVSSTQISKTGDK